MIKPLWLIWLETVATLCLAGGFVGLAWAVRDNDIYTRSHIVWNQNAMVFCLNSNTHRFDPLPFEICYADYLSDPRMRP